MKNIILLLLAVGVGLIAGKIIFTPQPAAAPTAAAIESTPAQPVPTQTMATPKPVPVPALSASAVAPANVSTATPVAPEPKRDDAAEAIHQAVDALLAAKSGEEKNNLFQQLLKDGKLDAVMAELKQRMTENPDNAQLPTTLGEAQLNKVRALKEAGGDMNDMGILAMQADQSFNAALKIDPKNWEANFVKASAMFYWPADATRDADVVQRLSGLIDQQETMTPNPAFVQSYIVLGNEYQKLGQPDKAIATWQLGLQKFPGDPTLLKKISGP